MEEIDLLELNVFLGSKHFTIPTRQIMILKSLVDEWISSNSCGAIIYGKSRSGKTRAIQYISEHLKNTYGKELPVIIFNATDHIPTQKTFYSQLLVTIQHEDPHKGTAVQMRQRLVNRLIEAALDTKYRRIVLFIDEAYLLDEKEYTWLIDIYNELYHSDIILTVFLIGTIELKKQKAGFITSKKQQIVLRFMVNEFEFKGITKSSDMMICLASMDKPFSMNKNNPDIILSELFFPNAYKDGITLSAYAKDIWDSFEEVKVKNHIESDELLMKYFMDAVIYCLKKYGVYGEQLYAPTKDCWINSIINTGFISAQSI